MGLGHWASPIIGKPWKPHASGPDAFDAWGLVRFVLAHRFGVEMESVAPSDFADGQSLAAFREAAHAAGWRPVWGEPIADDFVLIFSGEDGNGVGVMIDTARGVALLHSDGHLTARGPVGSVIAQPLCEVRRAFHCRLEVWRPAKGTA